MRRPPISTRTDTRFPYTTLFRSPHLGRCLALELEDGRDDRLEVGTGGGEGDLALPLWIGEVEDAARQVLLGDLLLVVHQHGGTGREAGPGTAGGTVLLRDKRQGLLAAGLEIGIAYGRETVRRDGKII